MTEFPEKTCSIERLVTIPADVEKVLNDQKTATRRNGVYAYPGEIMVLDGKEFTIDALYVQSLGDLTDEHAQQEGYADLEAYKQSMMSMHAHAKMPWLPAMKVWVHEYSAVEK
ncbi:ASCH domain-containing protein [Sporosarcina sp. ANT_H38]|uniref:ASCH domain-containing protein n=1 Tax=Sporosarcina sp. ANT_H38 TaxID=2597358 RepID=UPI0011F0AA01|nr:ASCH domain-containing protein [Sporosarcina sp. ANT_H38]KAA0965012.1 ASCH domain-containing protein [Sporosarcina sp. ANT_H38]